MMIHDVKCGFILHDSSQEFFKYDYRMVLLYTILIMLENCNLIPARKTAETSIKFNYFAEPKT